MEDTETSGRISIAAAPDVHALARAEVDSFAVVYPKATLELREAESSGQVISALLAGRADVAVAGRDLEPEEREVARRNGIEIDGHRIALDAMCPIVHAANPVRNVTLGELQRIWLAEVGDWTGLGGPAGKILPVLPPLQWEYKVFSEGELLTPGKEFRESLLQRLNSLGKEGWELS
ncbi:MAG TPA: substrate-binding domain-containing protein, partial [Candidatus Eisenbacteria bacterium]